MVWFSGLGGGHMGVHYVTVSSHCMSEIFYCNFLRSEK